MDLLLKLLEKDVTKRISSKDALNHLLFNQKKKSTKNNDKIPFKFVDENKENIPLSNISNRGIKNNEGIFKSPSKNLKPLS